MRIDWQPLPAVDPKTPPSPQPELPPVNIPQTLSPQVESSNDAASSAIASIDESGYAPNHPWHYYHLGDNAPPVQLDDIPPSRSSGRALKDDLPKSAGKRMVRVRELLISERSDFESTCARYQDVAERGVEALSHYDRNIAHGGNADLARASALAILYNRVSWHRGRLQQLEQEAGRGGFLQR